MGVESMICTTPYHIYQAEEHHYLLVFRILHVWAALAFLGLSRNLWYHGIYPEEGMEFDYVDVKVKRKKRPIRPGEPGYDPTPGFKRVNDIQHMDFELAGSH